VIMLIHLFSSCVSFIHVFADGIVKYMRSKAGPSSKVLTTVAEAEKFVASPEHSVIGKLLLFQ